MTTYLSPPHESGFVVVRSHGRLAAALDRRDVRLLRRIDATREIDTSASKVRPLDDVLGFSVPTRSRPERLVVVEIEGRDVRIGVSSDISVVRSSECRRFDLPPSLSALVPWSGLLEVGGALLPQIGGSRRRPSDAPSPKTRSGETTFAAKSAPGAARVLTIHAGESAASDLWAVVGLAQVEGVSRVPPLAPLPFSRRGTLGIALVGEAPAVVVDLASFLGLTTSPRSSPRVVILRGRRERIAIWTDEHPRLEAMPGRARRVTPPPSVGPAEAVFADGRRMLWALDVDGIAGASPEISRT